MQQEKIIEAIFEKEITRNLGAGIFAVPISKGFKRKYLVDMHATAIKSTVVPIEKSYGRTSKFVNLRYICSSVNARLKKIQATLNERYNKMYIFPIVTPAYLQDMVKRIMLSNLEFLPNLGILLADEDRIIIAVTERECYYLCVETHWSRLSMSVHNYYTNIRNYGKEIDDKFFTDYLTDATITGVYAEQNRWVIYYQIAEYFGWRREMTTRNVISTIHTGIDPATAVFHQDHVLCHPGKTVVLAPAGGKRLLIAENPHDKLKIMPLLMPEEELQSELKVRKVLRNLVEIRPYEP